MPLTSVSSARMGFSLNWEAKGKRNYTMAKILCLDFDGVLHSYTSGWQGVDVVNDPPVVDVDTGVNAIEWLTGLLHEYVAGLETSNGWKLIKPVIYSSRSIDPKGIAAMKNWSIKHGLPNHFIESGLLEFPTQKPSAFLSLDDRALCFTGVFPTRETIDNFKPWNKR